MESRLSFVEETIGISPSTSASQISSNANISKRLAVISNALKEIETKGLHDIASNCNFFFSFVHFCFCLEILLFCLIYFIDS